MILGVDEMAEWYNSFVLVPKPSGKVQLCLDLARLNQALISSVCRVPTDNNILLRLAYVRYLTLIGANSGYHNLKNLWNVFGIGDDILVVRYNDKKTDHDKTITEVLIM